MKRDCHTFSFWDEKYYASRWYQVHLNLFTSVEDPKIGVLIENLIFPRETRYIGKMFLCHFSLQSTRQKAT